MTPAPAQLQFLATSSVEPEHWNRALLLVGEARLDVEALREALARLCRDQSSLRMRFERRADRWTASLAELATDPVFDVIRLPGGAEGRRQLEEAAAALQASLDLARGPLLRAAYFEGRDPPDDRLLLLAHHLVADTLSWPILVDDLRALYRQIVDPTVESAPRRAVVPFERWTERLSRRLSDDGAVTACEAWAAELHGAATTVPVDYSGAAVEGAARWIEGAQPAEVGRAFTQWLPERTGIPTEALLLASLAEVLIDWTGEESLLVDVGWHGRAPLDDLDMSRTIGCFAIDRPVRLARSSGPWRDRAASLASRLHAATGHAHQLAAMRHGSPDPRVRDVVATLPRAPMSFDYLGAGARAEADGFRVAKESSGPLRSPRAPRTHLVQIVARIEAGELRTGWRYGEDSHRRSTIEELAARWNAALVRLAGT
jgi:hypothetical protein